jgi:ribosomal protein L16 Arg81 hydroxylase
MDQSFSFESIIAPLTPGDFLSQYWQRQPALCNNNASDRFSGLLSLKDVDFLVSSIPAVDSSWLVMVKDAVTADLRSWRNNEQHVDLSAVYRAYDTGYTVLLVKLHKRWPPIAGLCRELEGALIKYGVGLSRRIGCNLYLTPPKSQGFPPHYDDHDTLLLQIEGRKRWRIYDPIEMFPLERQVTPLPRERLSPLRSEIVMEPGHVLYMPRGFYHEAATMDGHSMHLTIGIYHPTWFDLVSKLLIADARFREALPIVDFNDEQATRRLIEQFNQRVISLAQSGDVAGTASKMIDETVQNLDPIPDDGFKQLNGIESLSLDTALTKRKGAFARLAPDGEKLKLIFPGSGFRASNQLDPVFKFMMESETFVVRDLPLLSDESKLQIATELVRDGLLKMA